MIIFSGKIEIKDIPSKHLWGIQMSRKYLAILISFTLILISSSAVFGQEEAPSVDIISPVGGQIGPEVQIDYKLADKDSDPVSINVEYSVDGSEFKPCTPDISGEGTDDLSTSSEGVDHTFVWDSKTDLWDGETKNITIRITPYKGAITGNPAITEEFLVLNEDIPPEADDPVSLLDLIDSGAVFDEFTCWGSASGLVANLMIRSDSDEQLNIGIDPSGLEGMVLVHSNNGEQDLVIADIPGVYLDLSGGESYYITPNVTLVPGQRIHMPVIGYCMNYNLKNPSYGPGLTLNPASSKTDIIQVRKLLDAIANTTFPENMSQSEKTDLTQIAIWSGQPENSNETLNGFSSRGYDIEEDDLPLLKRILNNSGVDPEGVDLFSRSKDDPPEEDNGDDDLIIMLIIAIAISITVTLGLFIFLKIIRKIRRYKGKRKHKNT